MPDWSARASWAACSALFVHAGLWFFQSFVWHSREQYFTALHLAQTLSVVSVPRAAHSKLLHLWPSLFGPPGAREIMEGSGKLEVIGNKIEFACDGLWTG